MTKFKCGDTAVLHSMDDEELNGKTVTIVGQGPLSYPDLYIVLFDTPYSKSEWLAHLCFAYTMTKVSVDTVN
jgi:hypothetical protein